jgi:PKD repeat protein
MMKFLSFKFAVLFFFFASVANSQEWINLRENGASFEEIRASFESEWENKTPEKGQGYNLFRRWENFVAPRVHGGTSWTEMSSYLKEAWEKEQSKKKSTPASAKSNANWTSIGPDAWVNYSYAPGNGRVNAVLPDPQNSSIIYVGTPAGGLWKTEDNGGTWEALTDELPTLGVSGIAIHPENSDIIYIGTGDANAQDSYGVGVLKSTDGGASWNTTGLAWNLNQNLRVHRLMMHPNNPEILFAATSGGLWKTNNGGLVWYMVLNGGIRDLEFHPTNPDIIYAGRNRIYRSEDGGEDWDSVNDGMPSSSQVGRISLAVSPDEPDMVYALLTNNSTNGLLGVYRSEDAGVSFELRTDTPNLLSGDIEGAGSGGQGWYDLALAVSPINANNVFVGGVNVWESNNGGSSFDMNAHWVYDTPGTNYVHADIHQLEFFGNRFYAATDGGLWSSTNYGNSFTNRSFGLEVSQCYRIGVSQLQDNKVITGLQDNGTMLNSGSTWFHVQGGDGMQCFFHPSDEDRVYCSSQYGALYRSTNGGADFNWAAAGIDDDGAWTTPWEIDPNDPNVMYAGYQNVWKTSNGGGGWVQVSNNMNETLRVIEISPVNGNTVYAASYDNIYKSSNGGNTWTEISFPITSQALTSLEASPFDLNTVYACVSGFAAPQKVFKTTDGGITWENIGEGLPNVPMNSIIEDPSLEGSIYVAGDVGVYHKHPELAAWQPFMEGLPITVVNEVEIQVNTGKLYAGTYGRGVWVSDLFEIGQDPPIADFSVERNTLCEGNSIQFFDESLNHYPSWTWTFEGGTPSSSNEQNPEVTWPEAGLYDISLTVENANGTSSITQESSLEIYTNQGLALPYFEGFEGISSFDEGNWVLTTSDELTSTEWQISNEGAYQGNQSAFIPNSQLDQKRQYELISEPIDLSGVDTVSFTLYYSYVQMHEDNDDRFRFYVSTDCGETWSLRKQWRGEIDLMSANESTEYFVPSDENEWVFANVTLSQNDLVENFRYKLWFENDNGNNIFVDNINLFQGVVSVDNMNDLESSMKAYPNPSSNHLTLDFSSEQHSEMKLDILSLDGRVVQALGNIRTKQGENRIQFSVADLPAGVYLIRLYAEAGSVQSLRFVKR